LLEPDLNIVTAFGSVAGLRHRLVERGSAAARRDPARPNGNGASPRAAAY
jgi:hypothetical protein